MPASRPPAAEAGQIVVAVTAGWDAPAGRLGWFERGADGTWRAAGGAVPALFGKNGSAWGRGLAGQSEAGIRKVEGDGRAPAGLFALGTIYGCGASLPAGADYPYHRVTEADAWVDDPAHPLYNRHVVVDPRDPPPWFGAMRMRLGDAACRWMIDVRHNADPPVAGAGSAIFIHARRGVDRPTAGCTALAEDDLARLVIWLRAARKPCFVLLPWAEYERLWRAWDLPPPEAAAGLAP